MVHLFFSFLRSFFLSLSSLNSLFRSFFLSFFKVFLSFFFVRWRTELVFHFLIFFLYLRRTRNHRPHSHRSRWQGPASELDLLHLLQSWRQHHLDKKHDSNRQRTQISDDRRRYSKQLGSETHNCHSEIEN